MNLNYIASIILEPLFRFLLVKSGLIKSWTGVLIISFLTGLIIILLYKLISNQKKMRIIKNKVKASILGIYLYREEPELVMKHFIDSLKFNFIYLFNSILIFIPISIPVIFLFSQTYHWYNYKPLTAGKVYHIRIKGVDCTESIPKIKNMDKEVKVVDTSFFPEDSSIIYDFIPGKKGINEIIFRFNHQTLKKKIIVSNYNHPVSPARKKSILPLFSSWEKQLPESIPFSSLIIDYPERTVFVGKFIVPLWALFFVSTIISGIIFSLIFKVEI